ncbi:unnamed protein product [Polarella glacialis]|uniref:Uncharacterized protein n=1 Tax=Polarella glacialis TaxID=89957 RepID=A0A813DDT7_POLGL|nr:unnamed protein product [Polarella glacialis]
MRLGDPCAVDAIGPEACYKAVKSIMLASDYIQDSHPDMQIAFELQRVKAPARGSNPETVKVRFHTALVQKLPVPDRPDVVAAKDTNPGLAAAELTRLLMQKGQTGIAVVGGMGPYAMHMSLKTVQMASRYMQKHMKENETLLAVACSQAVPAKDGDGGEKMRYVLSRMRGPAANPDPRPEGEDVV